MEVGPEDIQRMSAAIEDLCGLVLGEQKAYLIKHRLAPIARNLGCETLADLYVKLRSGSPSGLAEQIVDAITTHETQFFRDTAPFDALSNRILPELIDAKARGGESRRIRTQCPNLPARGREEQAPGA